jgi:hypothetical protein
VSTPRETGLIRVADSEAQADRSEPTRVIVIGGSLAFVLILLAAIIFLLFKKRRSEDDVWPDETAPGSIVTQDELADGSHEDKLSDLSDILIEQLDESL